jgi:hypothetical protein
MASNTGMDYTNNQFDNNSDDDDIEISAHKKDIRRRLDAQLDRRRLKQELEDYEGELDDDFDWDELDK